MKRIVAIIAMLFAPAAGATYKCVDEHGHTQIGDTPPAGCANVVMYEISRSGHVLRRIDPTPTAEQVKAREEKERQRRETEKREAEEKRRDKALLATFASEKEFDVARERNIEPLNGRIHSAQDRMKEIDKRMAKLEQDMEFYKSGKSRTGKEREMPHAFVAEQQRLIDEKKALVSSIAANEKEIQAQRERFDRDKKRWIDLRSGMSTVAEKK
jgi:hypothetical protein